jgi:hypothetical protein
MLNIPKVRPLTVISAANVFFQRPISEQAMDPGRFIERETGVPVGQRCV